MKINHNDLNRLGLGTDAASRAERSSPLGPASGTQRGQGAADQDSVQLSGLSRHLRLQASESAERPARIEQLRGDIQSGRYQPDPLAISRKIIEEALSLGGDI